MILAGSLRSFVSAASGSVLGVSQMSHEDMRRQPLIPSCYFSRVDWLTGGAV